MGVTRVISAQESAQDGAAGIPPGRRGLSALATAMAVLQRGRQYAAPAANRIATSWGGATVSRRRVAVVIGVVMFMYLLVRHCCAILTY